MTKPAALPDTQNESTRRGRGRPVEKPMPDPIPDTPENIAKAIMQGPPKEKWRYLDED
jgi:hypothetical protein